MTALVTERIFPKETLERSTWPPELNFGGEGRWVPFGPWRFNREAQIWQRTYDYIVNGDVKVTTQRIKHIQKGSE